MTERYVVDSETFRLDGETRTKWRVWEVDRHGVRWKGFPCRGTEEEARAELAQILATPPCRECGQPIGLVEQWHHGGDRLAAQRLCFGCDFWLSIARETDGIVIDGRHYTDGGQRDGVPHHALGFAGRRFVIRMSDGRVVRTNNLWQQGMVPPHFRDRLPDNAEFIEEHPDA